MQSTLAVLLVLVCAWAITSPRVPTGVLVTAGLMVLAAVALASLDDAARPARLLMCAFGGNVLVAAGLLVRAYRSRKGRPPGAPLRRATDFGTFDEGSHARSQP